MNIITPKEKILPEIVEIDNFLNTEIIDDVEAIISRGNDIAIYMARSGKLLVDSQYYLDEQMKEDVLKTLKETAREAGATAKAVNAIIDSLCKNERYLVNYCTRVNRTCTHQLDWCRTIISKAKEDMRSINFYQNSK